MKDARWLALAVGAGLGALGGCFSVPDLAGSYSCNSLGACPEGYSCSEATWVCCKDDGGTPACPAPPESDGGTDGGGQDAGADAGQDAGCTVPNPPDCTLGTLQGLCRRGQYSCATGVRVCEQVYFGDAGEICDGEDQDCDGTVDNFPPCANFLVPNAAYALGAERTVSTQRTPNSCLKGLALNTTELFDGARWAGQGPVPGLASGASNLAYAEATDGGSWDLSRPGQRFNLQLGGTLSNPASPEPFAGFLQPHVMLCGRNGGWKLFGPIVNPLLQVDAGARVFWTGNLSINNLRDAGAGWTVKRESAPELDLQYVHRVEVVLELADKPSGAQGGFDAGFSLFGFSSP